MSTFIVGHTTIPVVVVATVDPMRYDRSDAVDGFIFRVPGSALPKGAAPVALIDSDGRITAFGGVIEFPQDLVNEAVQFLRRVTGLEMTGSLVYPLWKAVNDAQRDASYDHVQRVTRFAAEHTPAQVAAAVSTWHGADGMHRRIFDAYAAWAQSDANEQMDALPAWARVIATQARCGR
jgi:hypothetical protein